MAVDASTPVGSSLVTGAIRRAAQATGTSFQYLLATAKVESDLNPNLTVRTSTATGLFQFIEQTWLATLKQAGPAFGYGGYATAISRSASGRYLVADPALRDEIMRLRKDPAANALMGGVFTQQNAAVMSSRLGRRPSEGELYIGHFFGPYAGTKAIALAASNPGANAAEIFPAAARANRPIFYDQQGQPRSIAGVCAELARRYQVARADTRTPSIAKAGGAPRPPAPIPPAVASTPRLAAPSVPKAAPTGPMVSAMAFAADANAPGPSSNGASPARTEAAGGMFHSLFQTGQRREAVAPAITELWSGGQRTQDGWWRTGDR
jgi:hypothetical protein